MKDQNKTKKQLVDELMELRQRIIELEKGEMEWKRAEELLQRERETFFPVLHKAPYGVALIDKDGEFLYINSEFTNITGYTMEDLLVGRSWFNKAYFFPEYRLEIIKIWKQDVIQRGIEKVFSIICRGGESKEIEFKPTILGDGRIIVMLSDITGRKRAEEEYKTILRTTMDGFWIVDMEGRFLDVNDAYCHLIGYSRDELLAMRIPDVETVETPEETAQRIQQIMETGGDRFETRHRCKDGRIIDIEVSVNYLETDGGRMFVFLRDITERKRTEEALKESEEKYRTLFESSRDAVYITTREGKLIDFNQAFLDLLGYSQGELMAMYAQQLYVDAVDRYRFQQEIEQMGFVKDFGVKLRKKDGIEIECLLTSSLRLANDGSILGYQGIIRDITERKRAEEAIYTERQRFQTLSEDAPFGMVMIDKDGTFKYINPKFRELFGYDLNDVPNGKTWFRKAYPDPAYRHHVISTWINDLESHGPGEKRPRIFTVTCKDGTKKVIDFIPVQLETGENLIACEDTTALKQAEEKMVALQEQLRQSQKMEAIGRLAGGIAHDFNNLLTIIRGYSQLSLLELKESDPLRENMAEVRKASDRASDLIRQLLAFSRRQILEMTVLDLNMVMGDLDKMLRRVIGEDIELVTLLAEDLGRVKTDPGQIQQVIMNLALNARDAMPNGGKLTIETANVELDEAYARAHIAVQPGRYVMLSMSDTGVGMGAEVREKIFEPFFTTKEKDKGTGLGLSTVYGIVKQSGGNIWVYSEPGRGSTFKIYLPRVDEPLEEVREAVVRTELPHGSETILVVEDDEAVRNLASQILKSQGYRVLEASSGEEALGFYGVMKEPIHLVLTDVVMPRMSGRELADHLISLYPEMKRLYMSGYTDDATVHHGVLEEGVSYIQKPFTMEGLAKKVREVLDKELS